MKWTDGIIPELDYIIFVEPNGKVDPNTVYKRFEKILENEIFDSIFDAGFNFEVDNIIVLGSEF